MYLLTAIGLSPSGSTHLRTDNIQNNTNNNRTTQIQTNVEECGPCPVFASFTLAFALRLRKKHGKTSVRVRKTSVRLRKISVKVQYAYYQKHQHITKPSQTHTLQNPLIHSHAHTHTTKQYKTTTVQIKTIIFLLLHMRTTMFAGWLWSKQGGKYQHIAMHSQYLRFITWTFLVRNSASAPYIVGGTFQCFLLLFLTDALKPLVTSPTHLLAK